MTILERNERAKQFVIGKLDLVSVMTDSDFTDIINYQERIETINDLIFVKAMGFRGVVATAITGKFLNPEYDPLNNFYGCNPRAIFEQGIFYAFEGRIPCGKSDPLNVAKNINILNNDWAQGKRPQRAAQAAVDYLQYIESAQGAEKEKLINLFFFKLLEYANSIAAISIEVPEEGRASGQLVARRLSDFCLKYPESGTIPQIVVFKILQKLYENALVSVEGGEESVFGTNTTSKKPADIWLEYDGKPFSLFEITVKKIDYKRIDDCLQSLHTLSLLDVPVNFICRIPDDISTLDIKDGLVVKRKGKTIKFFDIREFIHTIVSLLRAEQIQEIMQELQSFVEKIDRPVTTKEGWNKIFSSIAEE